MAILLRSCAWVALVSGLASAAAVPCAVVDGLLEVAVTHPEQAKRDTAVQSLVMLNWKPNTPAHWAALPKMGPTGLPLIDRLLGQPDAANRAQAVQALVEMARTHGKARADALSRLLRTGSADAASDVRKAAATGLAALKWPANEGELAGLLGAGKPPPWPLIDLLLQLPGDQGHPALVQAITKLAQAPATRDEAIRRLLALASRAAPPAASAIFAQLVRLDWRPTRSSDWKLLTRLGPASAPVLARLLKHEHEKVRLGAVHALVGLAQQHKAARADATNLLLRVATDDQQRPAVRQAARVSLVTLEGPGTSQRLRLVAMGADALPLIDGLLKAAKPEARVSAVQSLVAVGKRHPNARPGVVLRLRHAAAADGDPRVRRAALEGLLGCGWPATDDELANALEAGEPEQRLIEALLGTADAAAVARLGSAILRVAQREAAARPAALAVLPVLLKRSSAPALRKEILGFADKLAQDKEPAWALKGTAALVSLASADGALRSDAAARLLGIATTRREPAVRDAAVSALATLQWRPANADDRKKLASMGPLALPLVDALLADADPATRASAIRIVADIAQQHQAARDEAMRRHFRVATSDKVAGNVQLAVKALRGLGWPRSDKEWADLVKLGAHAPALIHVMLEDQDPQVRAKAAVALGQVGAAYGHAKSYAKGRLIHLVGTARHPRVRGAAIGGLVRLGWPAAADEWKSLEAMGCGALCVLAQMVRTGHSPRRSEAMARARELCSRLLPAADSAGDNPALLDGLELQWDIGFEDRHGRILALVGKGQLEQACALFGEAISQCEGKEKRIHALVIEAGMWPMAGARNKWQALLSCLQHQRFAKLRTTWPLTVGNWKATLQKRSQEAGDWQAAYAKASQAPRTSARVAVIDDYLKRSPQSFYSQFAWKWKDSLRGKPVAPAPGR